MGIRSQEMQILSLSEAVAVSAKGIKRNIIRVKTDLEKEKEAKEREVEMNMMTGNTWAIQGKKLNLDEILEMVTGERIASLERMIDLTNVTMRELEKRKNPKAIVMMKKDLPKLKMTKNRLVKSTRSLTKSVKKERIPMKDTEKKRRKGKIVIVMTKEEVRRKKRNQSVSTLTGKMGSSQVIGVNGMIKVVGKVAEIIMDMMTGEDIDTAGGDIKISIFKELTNLPFY